MRGFPIRLLLAAACLGPMAAAGDFAAELEARSLRYFVERTHPVTGLVPDRAPNSAERTRTRRYRVASTAATGFGMAVLASAAARGKLPVEEARDKVGKALRFAWEKLDHHGGWLYHFVDIDTGRRAWGSEVSTVDTAWFLAGALYAARVLGDPAVDRLAAALYERLDFGTMMTHGGALPAKRTLSMGWTPETGYLPWQWDSYAEHLVLVLLGLGHPTRPLPAEAWHAWTRTGPVLGLFVHQYSHLFVDFRGKSDGTIDYHRTSVEATLRDRRQCAADGRYATYRAGFWGLSASGSAKGYQAFSPEFHDGTVCPGCAGASAMFLPELVLKDLKKWATGPFGRRIWGRYGFADSLNLEPEWFDPDVIGITVGAQYLALANLDPRRPVWRDFEAIPSIRRALARAGLVPGA